MNFGIVLASPPHFCTEFPNRVWSRDSARPHPILSRFPVGRNAWAGSRRTRIGSCRCCGGCPRRATGRNRRRSHVTPSTGWAPAPGAKCGASGWTRKYYPLCYHYYRDIIKKTIVYFSKIQFISLTFPFQITCVMYQLTLNAGHSKSGIDDTHKVRIQGRLIYATIIYIKLG